MRFSRAIGAVAIGAAAAIASPLTAAVAAVPAAASAGTTSVSPTSIDFGTLVVGNTGAAQTVTVTASGDTVTIGTVALGGTTPAAFTITNDGCTNAVLAAGQSCTVAVAAHPTAPTTQQATLTIPDNTAAGSQSVPLTVAGQSAIGTFYPTGPTRILDTRTGLGAPKAMVGPGGVVHLQVAGVGGIPASGVSSVVLNVTVTGPTAGSYLTVYPTGVTRPTASNLNFPAGWTGANSVTVQLGTGGKVDIFNANGKTQVIADVTGYYGGSESLLTSVGMGGQLQTVNPWRWFDTRNTTGAIDGDSWLWIWGDFGTFNPHVRSFVLNVTAIGGNSGGYLTTWNGQGDPPTASTLDFSPHKVVSNLATVPISTCTQDIDPNCVGKPMIAVFNGSTSPVNFILDAFGLYDDGTASGGARFHPISPARIVDSRKGLGTPAAIGANSSATIVTPSSIAGVNTWALALNLTAVSPTQNTYLSVYPAGATQSTVSNIDPSQGQTIPNAVLTAVGMNNDFTVYNRAGTTNIVVDVAGTFDDGTTLGPNSAASPAARPNRAGPAMRLGGFVLHHS